MTTAVAFEIVAEMWNHAFAAQKIIMYTPVTIFKFEIIPFILTMHFLNL